MLNFGSNRKIQIMVIKKINFLGNEKLFGEIKELIFEINKDENVKYF